MDFLNSVDIQDIKQLLFTDSLVTFSDEDHAVGELSITVDIVSRIGQPCLLVNANSHGIVGGVPCGTSVTAHLKPNLETLEQIYHEYVELENHQENHMPFSTVLFSSFCCPHKDWRLESCH
ncbi:ciliogenesis-associated TTC17-interacting protein-like [Limulus polyphemus]|uniref:Ciliogenesis-associated TTC17-interacting protein-like n=1 Tax=Limulus polyphemus TaxID=6850 RepID=A0ABM1BL27_LIMPO|nr:ciliogenesis-associated TTC17-interacting protein-like [Limulus polyphemus]